MITIYTQAAGFAEVEAPASIALDDDAWSAMVTRWEILDGSGTSVYTLDAWEKYDAYRTGLLEYPYAASIPYGYVFFPTWADLMAYWHNSGASRLAAMLPELYQALEMQAKRFIAEHGHSNLTICADCDPRGWAEQQKWARIRAHCKAAGWDVSATPIRDFMRDHNIQEHA